MWLSIAMDDHHSILKQTVHIPGSASKRRWSNMIAIIRQDNVRYTAVYVASKFGCPATWHMGPIKP